MKLSGGLFDLTRDGNKPDPYDGLSYAGSYRCPYLRPFGCHCVLLSVIFSVIPARVSTSFYPRSARPLQRLSSGL